MNFPNSTFEVDKYCYDDVVTPRNLINYMHRMSSSHIPEIKKRHLQRPCYDRLLG